MEQHREIKKNESALVNIKGFIFYSFTFQCFFPSKLHQSEEPDIFERNKLAELPLHLFSEHMEPWFCAPSCFKTIEGERAKKDLG